MASRLARLSRACLLTAAAAACLTGCVGMPNSGPVGVFSAGPQSTVPDVDFEGPIPAGPEPGWAPSEIVSRFLAASASYPTFASIASQYLAGPAGRNWNPGWRRVTIFQNLNVPDRAVIASNGQQAKVEVTGVVQATLNSSGEFVSAQARPTSTTTFNLVKVNGQWRIANPPAIRLMTMPEFYQNYKPQDLYFINPNSPAPVLVPDSVFVPQQTSPTTLAINLVTALLQGPKTTWLHDATTSFPSGALLLNITLAGDTAVVNLGGTLARASAQSLEQVSAQLLWTLATPQASVSSPIQAVQLEINGQAWIPPEKICGNTQSRSPVQQLVTYGCYDPYPQTQASFSFVGNGMAWSRCGSAQPVAANSIGSVVPVFGRGSRVLGAHPCLRNGLVSTQSQETPPGPARVPGTPAMAAVSPDGQYAAYVVRGKRADTVYVRSLAGTGPARQFSEPDVTSLSWDRNDDLWFSQDGSVWMVSASGQPYAVAYQGPGNVLALSVAPDGVRIALLVKVGSQRLLKLTAFDRGGPSATGQPASPSALRPWLDQGVQLGPNLAYPVSLTWYDADSLLVLADTGSQNVLYQVPVDGQTSSAAQQTPPDAISITAYGAGNALVAGLTGEGLDVAASLEGPWLSLGVRGANPAYP